VAGRSSKLYPDKSSWEYVNNGLGNGLDAGSVGPSILCCPYGVFAGLQSGVYRLDSVGAGAAWKAKNKGLSNSVVTKSGRFLPMDCTQSTRQRATVYTGASMRD
jgi:hypothetical protein